MGAAAAVCLPLDSNDEQTLKPVQYMTAVWNNITLAEAPKSKMEKVEGNWYFPPGSLTNQKFVEKSDHSSVCPWKGTAAYLNIKIGDEKDQLNENAIWYYPNPKDPSVQRIQGYFSFWKGVIVSETAKPMIQIKYLQAKWKDLILAQAPEEELQEFEGDLYFPPYSFNTQNVAQSKLSTNDVVKGKSSNLNIKINDEIVCENAITYYNECSDAAKHIQSWKTFSKDIEITSVTKYDVSAQLKLYK